MTDYSLTKLRAIACIMVVLLHCAALDFYAFSSKWTAVIFYDSITRVAVPIFFMLSGATLLAKQESISVFLKKRFIRIIPALIFWTFFYLIYFYTQGITFYWPALLYTPVSSHLWYLYAIIGVYLFIPVIRRFVQNATTVEIVYFLLLWLCILTGIWVIGFTVGDADSGIDLIAVYQLYPFCGYIGYVVLGYFLYYRCINKNVNNIKRNRIIKNISLLVFFLSALVIFTATFIVSKSESKPTQLFMTYLTPVVVIGSGTFFYFMLQSENIKEKLSITNKIISFIAKYSFGIYCVHSFVLEYIVHLAVISRSILEWIYLPLLAIVVLVISVGIVRIMGMIKPLTYVI